MIIEGNEKEKAAMAEFHKGNRKEGLRLQEEFAAAFREEYKEKDHCPCKKACRYHGNCKECVAIHRAHQEHVPNCMRELINKKLKGLSELTEHTIAYEIEPPKEILRPLINDFLRKMAKFRHQENQDVSAGTRIRFFIDKPAAMISFPRAVIKYL